MEDKRPRRDGPVDGRLDRGLDDRHERRTEGSPRPNSSERPDTRRIYVANLAERTKEEDLLAAFKKFGRIKDVRVITDPATGRNKGYGFVTMERAEDGIIGQREAHNKLELDGKVLVVEIARGSGYKESTPVRYHPYPERRRSPPREARDRREERIDSYPDDYRRQDLRRDSRFPPRYDPYPPYGGLPNPEVIPYGYVPVRRDHYRDPYIRRDEREWSRNSYPSHGYDDYYGSSVGRAPRGPPDWERREWDGWERHPSTRDFRDREPRDNGKEREPRREIISSRDRENRNGGGWESTRPNEDNWSGKRDVSRGGGDEHPRRQSRETSKRDDGSK